MQRLKDSAIEQRRKKMREGNEVAEGNVSNKEKGLMDQIG